MPSLQGEVGFLRTQLLSSQEIVAEAQNLQSRGFDSRNRRTASSLNSAVKNRRFLPFRSAIEHLRLEYRGFRGVHRTGSSPVDHWPLPVEMPVAEQPVDALDAALGERGAPQGAPEVRARQLPAADERADDRHDGPHSGRVDRRHAVRSRRSRSGSSGLACVVCPLIFVEDPHPHAITTHHACESVS